MKEQRNVIFHKHHFVEFYVAQTKGVQEKIDFVFTMLRTVDRVPKKFLAYMEGSDGLYEIRVEYSSTIFRIFCCFDKGNLVVLFNGFQKKTQKTPRQEMDLATRLKKEYFSSKK
ncbi:MAG: type II toxin-antitoxin system RelE/ParE family toxin [Bacteroidota bacterium]|nr:type II toxin-antitoxin system RelE/ParE family toxin [Bacteroidota bacterium]